MADRPEKPSDERCVDARRYAESRIRFFGEDPTNPEVNLARWALWLESELTARTPTQEALHAAITEAHERWTSLFFMSRDNSSHWYIVPAAKRAEWDAWCELSEDDERAWDAPEYAERLNGSPELVEFRRAELTARTAETEEQAAERELGAFMIENPGWVYEPLSYGDGTSGPAYSVMLSPPDEDAPDVYGRSTTRASAIRAALAKARGGEGG
jgi:hypothetical protein